MNPGMFLLCRYRDILLCFYYVATETYCVANNECSIMLEICPTPNPTLNIPNSVNKCNTDIKMYLLIQPGHYNFLICRFELLCRTVITQDSNRSSSTPKYVSVLCELPNKLAFHENPSNHFCSFKASIFDDCSGEITHFRKKKYWSEEPTYQTFSISKAPYSQLKTSIHWNISSKRSF